MRYLFLLIFIFTTISCSYGIGKYKIDCENGVHTLGYEATIGNYGITYWTDIKTMKSIQTTFRCMVTEIDQEDL